MGVIIIIIMVFETRAAARAAGRVGVCQRGSKEALMAAMLMKFAFDL